MQYERNDTIIYDEGFQTSSEKEYYDPEEKPKLKKNESEEIVKPIIKKTTANSVVLVTQLIICILLAIFLYVTKNYFSELYSSAKDNFSALLNDSLIIDGNDLNDYFIIK